MSAETLTAQKAAMDLRKDTVGHDHVIQTPFGPRKLLYCDFTASGRALKSVEGFVQSKVMPNYANTHTMANSTAQQTTHFREEARQVIKEYLNATEEDALIFSGAGTTAAVNKFVDILVGSNFVLDGEDTVNADVLDPYLSQTTDGPRCILCSVTFDNAHQYLDHRRSVAHCSQEKGVDAERPREKRVVVFVDPMSHHSSVLPFREIVKQFPLVNTTPILSDSIFTTSKAGDRPGRAQLETYTVRLCTETGRLDVEDLARRLVEVDEQGARAICFLTAGSNVTGVNNDVAKLTSLIHKHHGLACWDFAATAGHVRPDCNPAADPTAAIDAGFFSPHKLLGGPGTPGLLLAKKRLLRNAVPSQPGGGVVFFVGMSEHVYELNPEHREEAGTPDIVGAIRCGLVYDLHLRLPPGVMQREHDGLAVLLNRWGRHPRIQLVGPVDDPSRSAVVSFNIAYCNDPNSKLFLHHNFVVTLLNDLFGVQSRGGCACAGPYWHHLLGIDDAMATVYKDAMITSGQEALKSGFVRVGVHFSMSQADVESLAQAVEWIAWNGWKLLPLYSCNLLNGGWTYCGSAKVAEPMSLRFPRRLAKVAAAGKPPSNLVAAADAVAKATVRAVQRKEIKTPDLKLDAINERLLWFAHAGHALESIEAGEDIPRPAFAGSYFQEYQFNQSGRKAYAVEEGRSEALESGLGCL